MPYKDPERKRDWERKHREQRNTQRRQQRLEPQRSPVVRQQMPDPVLAKDSGSGWKLILGLTVGIAVILLGAMAGVNAASMTRNQ